MAATVEASSSKPAKLTRNSFRNLKSEIQRSSVGTTPSQEPPAARQTARVSGSPRVSKTLSPRRGSSATPTRPEQGRRKSNRARIIPNYSHVPDIEIDEDIPTPTASSSAEEATRQKTPSAIQSPASQRSTPPLGRPSRSKSPSADQESDLNPKRMAKPKKSWTHIVYEVIANSTRPTLTLQELGEAIMDRFPFFRSKPEILKSSPRNPLYCHPAFYKVTRDDKSLAWGIKPGQFFDKRTNKLLTAGTPGPDVVPSIEVSEQIIAETQQDPAANETPSSVSRSVEVEMKYDEPVKSPSLARNGTEETQQDSVTRTVIEIDPRNFPDETMVSPRNVQQSSLPLSTEADIEVKSTPQPSGPVFSQSRDQRRLAGLVHQDLVDTFSSEDMDRFLQETKLCYFKNMALKKEDVHQILDSIFPSGLRSSEEDLETCTSDLRKDFEDRTWSSDWFIKFVSPKYPRPVTLVLTPDLTNLGHRRSHQIRHQHGRFHEAHGPPQAHPPRLLGRPNPLEARKFLGNVLPGLRRHRRPRQDLDHQTLARFRPQGFPDRLRRHMGAPSRARYNNNNRRRFFFHEHEQSHGESPSRDP